MKFREATQRACHDATSGGHSKIIRRASGGRVIAFTYPRTPEALAMFGNPARGSCVVEWADTPTGPWVVIPDVNHGNMVYDWTEWRSLGFTAAEVVAEDWTECGGRCRQPCINVGDRCNNQGRIVTPR